MRYFVSGRSARSARISLGLLLFTAASAGAGRALAAPEDPDAEALINRGIDLREHGKDDEALAVFKKAFAKSPTPRARAQVALAEQALGLWTSAESDLVLCLAAAEDVWITKNRGALEGALAIVRRHLGSLEIRGTEGAEVLLDGVRLGTLPQAAPFRVEAGRRTVELRSKGFHPTIRNVEIAAGAVTRESMMLVALSPEPAAESNGNGEAGAGAVRDRGGAVAADSDPGRGQRILGWAFAATGGALLVTGGAAFLVRKGVIDDYNNNCPGLGASQPADCNGKIDGARTWLTVAIVSLVGGGVLAIGGLTVVATAPSRSVASTSGVRVGCAPSSLGNGATLTCAGSF